jgi:hypothetical protein
MKGTYRKDELLTIIRANQATHRAVFEAALDGYRKQALVLLEDTLEQVSKGATPELRILLARPEFHGRDYDRIIKMLEMEVADEISLDESQFAQYVMDDWDWKRTWVRRMSSYASASTEKAYGDLGDDD